MTKPKKRPDPNLSQCCGEPLDTACGLRRCVKCGHLHGQKGWHPEDRDGVEFLGSSRYRKSPKFDQ